MKGLVSKNRLEFRFLVNVGMFLLQCNSILLQRNTIPLRPQTR